MKAFKKIIAIVLCFSAISALFAGCNKTPKTSTSLVLGVRANSPAISYNNITMYDSIYNACYSYGEFSAITVEGEPEMFASYSIQAPDKLVDGNKHKSIAEDYTEQIINVLSGASAKTPEADTLQAITMSANALNSSGSEVKQMLIYDSGLSTSGLLNFADKNIIDSDPQVLVERLQELNAIPDLSQIDVSWVGLGEVVGEQARLSTSYKAKLQAIYDAILQAGKAKSIHYDTSPLTNNPSEAELPYVSSVPIPQDSIGDNIDIIKFDSQTINFQKNTAELIDETSAKKALAEVAVILKDNPSIKVVLAASTASYDTEEFCLTLAEKRAKTVKTLLMDMGVSDGQMRIYAIGRRDSKLRVDDLDSNGELIASEAEKNRVVFVINEDNFEEYI